MTRCVASHKLDPLWAPLGVDFREALNPNPQNPEALKYTSNLEPEYRPRIPQTVLRHSLR